MTAIRILTGDDEGQGSGLAQVMGASAMSLPSFVRQVTYQPSLSGTTFNFDQPTLAGNIVGFVSGSGSANRRIIAATFDSLPMDNLVLYDGGGSARWVTAYELNDCPAGTAFTITKNTSYTASLYAYEIDASQAERFGFGWNNSTPNDPGQLIAPPGETAAGQLYIPYRWSLSNSGTSTTRPPNTVVVDSNETTYGYGYNHSSDIISETLDFVFFRKDRTFVSVWVGYQETGGPQPPAEVNDFTLQAF